MTDTATRPMDTNRYLAGNFGPVRTETSATELKVTGTIPADLDGRYLRNGPNPIIDPDPDTYHWFTGNGMVHGVRLRDGRADWYRNRYVRAGEVPGVLGEPDPGGAAPHGGFDGAPNTNVIGHGGRYFAIVEAGSLPVEIDGDLNTVGRCNFDGTLPNGYTAHPKLDPATGELHAVCYFWGLGNNVQHVVIGPDAKVTKVVSVATHGSPMLHDCAMTESVIAVFDFPVAFDLEAAQSGRRFPYRWFDDYPCRVGLLPRNSVDGTDTMWFDVTEGFVFHPLNAYDDGSKVVIDVSRHPKMFANDQQGPNEGTPMLWRWTFDRATGRTTETQISDFGMEFPRPDERLAGRKHRYGYATHIKRGDGTLFGTGTLKTDLTTGNVERHDHGAGRHPGEFVFVPREGSAAEDDGYLMGFVHDDTKETADLVILSAQNISAPAIATVHIPARVPYGFHGNWIPSA
jgi:carotenoid cleavage oxygenase